MPRAVHPGLDMSFLPGYIGFAAGYTGGLSLATALLAVVGLQASIKLHNTTLRAVRTATLVQHGAKLFLTHSVANGVRMWHTCCKLACSYHHACGHPAPDHARLRISLCVSMHVLRRKAAVGASHQATTRCYTQRGPNA